MRAGELPLQLQPCNLEDLARRALDELRPLAMRRNLRLELLAERKPSRLVIDAARIHQVMINLLSNAIKFTPQAGKIQVSIRKASSREIQVSILDTGQGIHKDEKEKIFDRFYSGGGFGLGLPIARQIVLAHGGKMWVESEPGKGSVFSFALPIKRANLHSRKTAAPSTVHSVSAIACLAVLLDFMS